MEGDPQSGRLARCGVEAVGRAALLTRAVCRDPCGPDGTGLRRIRVAAVPPDPRQ